MIDLSFYRNKKILVTGHTGFKGTWLCELLRYCGSDVYGYALKAPDESLYNICNLDDKITSYIGDIRDFDNLLNVFKTVKPEIVFHMAAQAIVKQGYEQPTYTYETNIMGTVNVLECIRLTDSVRSIVNITTDKVYLESNKVHKEDDILNGYDPYSNSKSCSELISQTYQRSYFNDRNIAISTLRSGNVIGGGDFGKDRIMTDCIKAYLNGEDIIIRNPIAIRPYQHVLNSLTAYLLINQKQYKDLSYAGAYNVGPDLDEYLNNEELVKLFIDKTDSKINYVINKDNGPHEADVLYLDNTKLKETINIEKRWDIDKAMDELSNFIIKYKNKEDLGNYLSDTIRQYYEK